MDDDKRARRAAMRRVRAAIPDRDLRVASIWTSVLERCRARDARTVMAFVGVGSEPDTRPLIEQLVAVGTRVALPRIEGGRIVAVLHEAGDALLPGTFGIPEPAGGAIDPRTIDVVLVPGLAFTRDGRRLGQGGGYYDRFLPLLGEGCLTIGVCFAEQIVGDVPTEAHDRSVDVVLTDAVQE